MESHLRKFNVTRNVQNSNGTSLKLDKDKSSSFSNFKNHRLININTSLPKLYECIKNAYAPVYLIMSFINGPTRDHISFIKSAVKNSVERTKSIFKTFIVIILA